jgi:hypothetical protein
MFMIGLPQFIASEAKSLDSTDEVSEQIARSSLTFHELRLYKPHDQSSALSVILQQLL